jgi:biotin carboxyl carrier protein
VAPDDTAVVVSRWVATVDGQATMVEINSGDGRYRIVVGEQVLEVDARRVAVGLYTLLVDGVVHVAEVATTERGTRVDVDGSPYLIEVEEHTRHVIRTRGGAGARDGGQVITAPLPGRVTHVAVSVGDRVEPGDTILVIEAMKMENEFRASVGGTVAAVHVGPGQAVNTGDVLAAIE